MFRNNRNMLCILAGCNLLVLLIVLVWGLTRPSVNYTYSSSDLSVHQTSLDGEESSASGNYLDNSMEGTGKYIATPPVSLTKGIYLVTVSYQTNNSETDYCKTWAESDNTNYRALVCDHIPLYRSLSTVQYHLYLNQNCDNVYIKNILLDNSPNYLTIQQVQISSSNLLYTAQLLCKVFLLLLLADCIFLIWEKRKIPFLSDRENLFVFAGLSCAVLAASYPLFSDYLMEGHDLPFHLMRIEGLKNGLLSLQLPVRIQPGWLADHGYPVSIYYGDLLLVLPALLRIIGVPIQDAYRFYVFFIQIATAWVAYYCFYRMTSHKYAGLAASVVYLLNPYRLSDLYIRGSVGEYTAMLFLPLILYGLWKIYTQDTSSPSYKRSWILPALGFSGIIQTHVISCEMVGIFTLLTCLLLFRRTFRKPTFLALLKTAGFTLLLNAWFLIPFLSMSGENINVFVRDSQARIQSQGAFVFQLFATQYSVSGLSADASQGAAGEFPLSIGLPLSFALLLFICFCLRKRKVACGLSGKIALLFTAFALFLSTNLFPYDRLSDASPLLERIFSSLQFPWRFLTMAVLFLAWITGMLAALLLKRDAAGGKKEGFWLLFSLCALACIQSMDLTGTMMNELPSYRIYDNVPELSSAVGRGEYLPVGTEPSQLFAVPTTDGKVELQGFSQAYNQVAVTVSNPDNSSGYVDVPLLYYSGYTARDVSDGTSFPIQAGDNNRIRIIVPEGYQGTIRIAYQEPVIWRIAEAVSLASLLFLLIYAGMNRKKGSR